MKDITFDIPFIDEIRNYADTFLYTLMATPELHCLFNELQIDFAANDLEEMFDESAPEDDPDSIHEQVDAPFQP